MSIKKKIITKLKKKDYTHISIDGINGSGKTTFFKKLYKKQIIDNYLWKSFKKDKNLKLLDILEKVSDIHKTIELLIVNNINSSILFKKVEEYSTGQKKKIDFAMSISIASILWYMDEPKNYLDDISYHLLNNRKKKHLNLGGKIIISKNSYITEKNLKKIKISLSRFELLTPHLSNECSTTEL